MRTIEQIKKKIRKIEKTNPELFKNINNSILQLNKDLDTIISFEQNKLWSTKKIQGFDSLSKLQVGGGSRILNDYINLDVFLPANIIWDVRSGIPFPENRFKEVFCEHFFEHLDFPKSATFFLKEAFRTLKSDGELKLVVPDCGKPLAEYSSSNKKYFDEIKQVCFGKRISSMEINSNIDVINYLFRDQFDNPQYTVHWWGYDYENLSAMLKKAGFSFVKRWKFDAAICNPKRKINSIYIKAIK